LSRESVEKIGFFFFFLGVIAGLIELLFRAPFDETLYACFGFSILFFILSIFFPKEKTEWECQQCHAVLIREQIKFGLCPYCSTKIEGFRGLHRGI